MDKTYNPVHNICEYHKVLAEFPLTSSKTELISSIKSTKIMNFVPFNTHTPPLFKNCNIFKFADIINAES